MKKVLLVLLVLALFAMPVFADTNWRVGVAGGYPQSGIFGQVKLGKVGIELMAAADYSPSVPFGFGAQLYGTYDIPVSEVVTLLAGVGATARIVQGFNISPAARIGAEFNIKNSALVPFVRGDFGYAIQGKKFFWEAAAGLSYKF